MGILGHGVDIVDISRFRESMERQGEDFLNRVFSEGEREYCSAHRDFAQHFAARFAAKEAFGKAMGVGILAKGTGLKEMEVFRKDGGVPQLILQGEAKKFFEESGGKEIFLSLSHDRNFALASIIVTK